MPTAARRQMDVLLRDAESLGEVGNRKPNSAYVRAALVVLCAAWQTYVEGGGRADHGVSWCCPGRSVPWAEEQAGGSGQVQERRPVALCGGRVAAVRT